MPKPINRYPHVVFVIKSKIMSNQLKTRKASDLDAALGIESFRAASSVPPTKKAKREPSIFLLSLKSALKSKLHQSGKWYLDEIHDEDLDMLDALIANEISSLDDFWLSIGYSLFENAAKVGQLDTVKLLLKHAEKKNIKAMAKCGKLLFFACSKGYIEVVKLLLEHGFNIGVNIVHRCPTSDKTCLSFACCEGKESDLVEILLENGADPNLLGSAGLCLVTATIYNKIDFVKVLLDNGADVNLVQPGGATALIHACRRVRLDIARLLLDRGADTNTVDSDGDTPLISVVTCEFENKENLVRLLLERGADPSIHNHKGKTALDYAAKGSEIAQMILNAQLEPILK